MQKLVLRLFGILAALMICLATGLAQGERPETGSVIEETEMNGLCRLDIINNGTYDAVAYLCTMQKEILWAAYIREKDVLNLTEIEDGSYDLYFRIGEGWNASSGRFDINSSSSRMEELLVFETLQTPEGVKYTWGQVTLNAVSRGNMDMVDVTEEDFPA